jgi:hypothetical protein
MPLNRIAPAALAALLFAVPAANAEKPADSAEHGQASMEHGQAGVEQGPAVAEHGQAVAEHGEAVPGAPAGATGDAAPGPAPTATCGYTGTNVFAAWKDRRAYTLVPDGGFENGADGWTLAGGAAVAEGNETAQVGGAADHQSLALPAGSSATSPAICVERRAGTLRLFARTDGSRKARLKIEVVYANGHKSKAAKLRAGDSWAPTRKLAVALGRAKGKGRIGTAGVTLRFTPVGEPAAWQVDDVYVDPRLRH